MESLSHKVPLNLLVNGRAEALAAEPRRTLLDVLRHDLGLCGAKEVCAMGNCGACTVQFDGRAVYACLVLAVECEGHEVSTVESLGSADKLHPLQRAFIDCDAFQCGYCTPGQLMSLKALFDREAAPGEEAIREALSGNLCRCGAYAHILEAARRVAGLDADGASHE